MRNTPIYNFSAGPATLPESVLRTAQSEMFDYNGTEGRFHRCPHGQPG